MLAACPSSSALEKVEAVVDFALFKDEVNSPRAIPADVTGLRPGRRGVAPLDNRRFPKLGSGYFELSLAERYAKNFKVGGADFSMLRIAKFLGGFFVQDGPPIGGIVEPHSQGLASLGNQRGP